MENLLSGLISSRTRIKLLMRFFLNPKTRSYLRELAKDFGVSTNAVREELNQLTRTDLLKVEKNGRSVFYSANTQHVPLPRAAVHGAEGHGDRPGDRRDRPAIGETGTAYLIDDYAEGKDTGIIDLILVGDINSHHLSDLSQKTERYINRKIRTLVLTREEFKSFSSKLQERPHTLLWEAT